MKNDVTRKPFHIHSIENCTFLISWANHACEQLHSKRRNIPNTSTFTSPPLLPLPIHRQQVSKPEPRLDQSPMSKIPDETCKCTAQKTSASSKQFLIKREIGITRATTGVPRDRTESIASRSPGPTFTVPSRRAGISRPIFFLRTGHQTMYSHPWQCFVVRDSYRKPERQKTRNCTRKVAVAMYSVPAAPAVKRSFFIDAISENGVQEIKVGEARSTTPLIGLPREPRKFNQPPQSRRQTQI